MKTRHAHPGVAILLIILQTAFASPLIHSCQAQVHIQAPRTTSETDSYRSEIGYDLGGWLKVGSTIIAGQIQGIDHPLEAQRDDGVWLSRLMVHLVVDDRIRGGADLPASIEIEIDSENSEKADVNLPHIPIDWDTPWEGVDLRNGARLLLVLSGKKWDADTRVKMGDVKLAVSDVSVASDIKAVVRQHQLLQTGGASLYDLARMASENRDLVLGSYLLSRQWLSFIQPRDSADDAVVAMGRLLSARCFASQRTLNFSAFLIEYLVDNHNSSISPWARKALIDSLVSNAVSSDPLYGRKAFKCLEAINGKAYVDINQYVTAEEKRQLGANYRKFFREEGETAKPSAFMVQLGIE